VQLQSTDILKVTEWLENEDPLTLSIEDMNYWFETGEKKLTYNQTTEFADSEIFKVVNCSKVYFYIFRSILLFIYNIKISCSYYYIECFG